jgi:cell fate regulator YaaT (PSP1 superfamily)
MPRVVSVAFRLAGRGYLFDSGDLDLRPGDDVVAPTAQGLDLGTVRTPPREIAAEVAPLDLKRILRKATDDDRRRRAENVAREQEAMDVAAEKIAEHGLPMKLIKADCTLDRGKMVLHFSAEGRVDFRALVRDLARALHIRVELHQVGVRDEAKLRGGLGPCGRALCCVTFLTAFDPVGIRMAKEQDLSLNPQKISGACGRLMCCLGFESDFYREAKKGLPRVGARVSTDRGEGKVAEINVLRGRAVVMLEDGGKYELSLPELARVRRPGAESPEPEEEEAELAEDSEENR